MFQHRVYDGKKFYYMAIFGASCTLLQRISMFSILRASIMARRVLSNYKYTLSTCTLGVALCGIGVAFMSPPPFEDSETARVASMM